MQQLPILPKGEYYELWFLAPDDRPGSPDRVSAGTFHPDLNGNTDVTFSAAVDPTIPTRVEVTAEPGNGNPQPSGKVVLRAKVGPSS